MGATCRHNPTARSIARPFPCRPKERSTCTIPLQGLPRGLEAGRERSVLPREVHDRVVATGGAPRPEPSAGARGSLRVLGHRIPEAGGGGGGSKYVWRYLDPTARFDPAADTFRVHAGFKEALDLVYGTGGKDAVKEGAVSA